jgi:chromosome segregation ATPase
LENRIDELQLKWEEKVTMACDLQENILRLEEQIEISRTEYEIRINSLQERSAKVEAEIAILQKGVNKLIEMNLEKRASVGNK